MIEYKKKALKRFNLDIRYSRFFKKNRLQRGCGNCNKEIEIGEVYFCHEVVSSYLV